MKHLDFAPVSAKGIGYSTATNHDPCEEDLSLNRSIQCNRIAQKPLLPSVAILLDIAVCKNATTHKDIRIVLHNGALAFIHVLESL